MKETFRFAVWIILIAFAESSQRDLTTNCEVGDPAPPNRVDTGARLADLRNEMNAKGLAAYIVPYDSEGRRQYISGFSGSDGDAIVTGDQAACWTDGRYYLQASQQLDCNWILMKDELPETPTYAQWLKGGANLASGSKVGADPTLMSASRWLQMKDELKDGGLELVSIADNLVDNIWSDKPGLTPRTLFPHDERFAGVSWQQKVNTLRTTLREDRFYAMVVSEPDEISWLFNVKAEGKTNNGGQSTNPFFTSMALITQDDTYLWLRKEEQSSTIEVHLFGVKIDDYDAAITQLGEWAQNSLNVVKGDILIPQESRFGIGATYAQYESVPETTRKFADSPIIYMRAVKNNIEVEGMINAHIKDARALVPFLAKLENDVEVQNSDSWTEVRVAEELLNYRAAQKDNRGVSFGTIAGSGPNGAVIHYRATPETDTPITKNDVFLLDSGGQYLDGTTDVTRTFHYGIPPEEVIRRYTWVLMGAIDLAASVVPEGTQDTSVDLLARQELYYRGLDYRHNTGHGIGAYGGVHENPISIRKADLKPGFFYENMFFSDEPGYYEDGFYGIRLETIMRVVKIKKEEDADDGLYGPMIGFEPVTLVPFEPKLIRYDMMLPEQIDWLNEYNKQINETLLEPYFLNDTLVRNWLEARTGFVDRSLGQYSCYNVDCSQSSAIRIFNSLSIMLILFTLTKSFL